MLKAKTMGIIFANMHDASVSEFTAIRSMASLPFGARYRQVDFYLSSLVNSGVNQVGVIVKNNYHSLMDHMGTGREWDLSRKIEGLSIFPPFSEEISKDIYHGRIGALGSIIHYLSDASAEYVILMDCDHVANVDYEELVNGHIDSGADLTMLSCSLPSNSAMEQNCVVVTPDETGRVVDLMINTKAPKGSYYSMNIMVIARELLVSIVEDAISHMKISFERDILTAKLNDLNIRCVLHKGFVKRIYSMRSYFEASMSLLDADVRAELFTPDKPIYTKVHDDPPVKYGLESKVANSLLADGCMIEGTVENSILSRGVKVGKGAVVKNCILLQDTVVGDGADIEYVIADKEVTISDGTELKGHESYPLYLKKYEKV
ncbi:MAG: glucose-1-phosphate adenylyltransferase subunit GlgD [Oscillospiraceae bacterium]|nr:glucose-1-phosphate adenylyltransferase subunit GlgD [Oscillospiraceae bacterium]